MTNFKLGDIFYWYDKKLDRTSLKEIDEKNIEYYNKTAFEEFPRRYKYKILMNNIGYKYEK